MITKKVIDLTLKMKRKFCEFSNYKCRTCVLKSNIISGCVVNLNIKKEIAFYKKYIAKLEKIGNREVEI
jgi:hypothetical protein